MGLKIIRPIVASADSFGLRDIENALREARKEGATDYATVEIDISGSGPVFKITDEKEPESPKQYRYFNGREN